MITIPRTILSDLEAALTREWLVTNGIGGYASSTVAGANTRRYHGLLVASFPPPLERQVLLAKVDEELIVRPQTYPLGTNEYHDGTVHPQGYQYLESFRLEFGIPTFEYHVGGVKLVKRIWMEHGANTVYLLYRVLEAPNGMALRIRPFCAFRNYHSAGGVDSSQFTVHGADKSVLVTRHSSPVTLRLAATGDFILAPDTNCAFLHRAERDRGFDCLEDLYTPGVFEVELLPGGTCAFVATAEPCEPDLDVEDALNRELERRRAIVGRERNSLRRELLLAADQFVVIPPGGGSMSKSKRCAILAGYHWFTEWGRDTMISLPGLLLATGRFPEAREILLRYAEWADEGMIPNRVTDEGSAEYDTADATLWYFQALHSYVTASGDSDIIRDLFPRLAEIVDWHFKGTRFGIRVDSSDGLLCAGRAGSQVTWMDARVAGSPVTPRIGKPVEINALWFNALNLMCSWARHVRTSADVYERAAEKCGASFRRRFWYAKGGYLFDVIDGPDGADSTLRPNQIMAVSLPYSPLDSRHRKSVVDAVERVLLTPYGLRTLSPDHPAYAGEYRGGPTERDRVYHQGPAWPWLLGQFADAHYRVYRDRRRVADLLKPFRTHIGNAGVGSISELFDGDLPHAPGGCIAQAWSVAEILRICTKLPSQA